MTTGITEDMIIRFFTKFCETMLSHGDGLWKHIGGELGYDEDQAKAIIDELCQRRLWLRERDPDICVITRTGLLRAKEKGIVSDKEYRSKRSEMFEL
jgi:hypothetical protein